MVIPSLIILRGSCDRPSDVLLLYLAPILLSGVPPSGLSIIAPALLGVVLLRPLLLPRLLGAIVHLASLSVVPRLLLVIVPLALTAVVPGLLVAVPLALAGVVPGLLLGVPLGALVVPAGLAGGVLVVPSRLAGSASARVLVVPAGLLVVLGRLAVVVLRGLCCRGLLRLTWAGGGSLGRCVCVWRGAGMGLRGQWRSKSKGQQECDGELGWRSKTSDCEGNMFSKRFIPLSGNVLVFPHG